MASKYDLWSAPTSKRWCATKEYLESHIGDKLSLVKYNKKGRAEGRMTGTIVKPYDNFVLVEIKNKKRTYKESFLYADFFTGLQPRNEIAFDEVEAA